MILDFEKPAKVKIDVIFDGGPPGGYVPQMSNVDAEKWKAKHFNKGKEGERIEIRKTFEGAQVFIIVAKDGWDLAAKNEHIVQPVQVLNGYSYNRGTCTKGYNVRISTNGAMLMSFAVWGEFVQAIEEAKALMGVK